MMMKAFASSPPPSFKKYVNDGLLLTISDFRKREHLIGNFAVINPESGMSWNVSRG